MPRGLAGSGPSPVRRCVPPVGCGERPEFHPAVERTREPAGGTRHDGRTEDGQVRVHILGGAKGLEDGGRRELHSRREVGWERERRASGPGRPFEKSLKTGEREVEIDAVLSDRDGVATIASGLRQIPATIGGRADRERIATRDVQASRRHRRSRLDGWTPTSGERPANSRPIRSASRRLRRSRRRQTPPTTCRLPRPVRRSSG